MKRLRPKISFSKSQLSVFLIVFAVLGLVLLIKSLAAPNPSLPGDLNNDNIVNVTDMSIMLTDYGTSNTAADINGDGTVNVLDMSTLLSHYGQTYSPPSLPTVTLTPPSATITTGQSANLSWTSTNATACSAGWTSQKGTTGSQSVAPTSTTTYTITCSGAGGSASDSSTVTVSPVSGGTLNTVAKIIYDMEPPNEGSAHGEGTFNIPPKLSYNMPPPGTGWVEAWGTIYADLTNTYPANVRVEVKNEETYIWSISQNKWIRVQAVTAPGGALYAYNFASHIAGNKRPEPDGGVSMIMQDNYLFHFFPVSHAAIMQSDVGGVFTTVDARLIPDQSSGPNNLAQAKFLVQSGGDFYPSSGTYSFNGSPNVGLGGSKHIYLTPAWQAVSYYTGGPSSVINDSRTKYPSQAWTEARLQSNPPPLDGMGLP